MKSLFRYITESTIDTFKRKYSSLYNKISHNFTPEHNILVISNCGLAKYDGNDRIPAREMFVGQANQTLLKVLPDLPVDWIILSGGWGMLDQSTKIHTYDDVIQELTDTELKELIDFVKYTDDLERYIKKGQHKEIYITLSAIWIKLVDWKRICDAAGDKCKIYIFANDNKDLIPSNMINIDTSVSMIKKFHGGKFFIKEKIVTDYLSYRHDHADLSITQYIKKIMNY